MTQNNFLKISDMRSFFQQPKASDEIGIRMKFSSGESNKIRMSNSYASNFTSVFIKKRGRLMNFKDLFVQELERKYNSKLPVDQ